MPNDEEVSKGLNILCTDGGGVRGLSSLIVLQEIILRIENRNGGRKVYPHEYFDFVAGTGTGGIIACMLGRLRMSVGEAIEEYVKVIKHITSEKKMSGPTMYKGTKLQEALKAMVREATGDAEKMMSEGRVNEGCKTAVFAMARHNLNAGLPTIFRTYTVTANPGPNCAIWQALYATMAHPELFKSIDIINSSVPQSFVGGELGCSNPIAHVLSEVKRVYPDRHVSCIISIGAGHARTIQVPSPSWWNLAIRTHDVVVMKEMATDSERVAEEMALRFQCTSRVYFRFNVDQGMQKMKNGSWERLGETLQHTKAYLQKSQTDNKLGEVVKASTERRRVISTAHAAGQILDVIEDTKRPTGFRRCPAPTKLYTGRNDENAQITACITGNNHERRVCVVYGLGGIGKTQLVLNVVERTWDEWDYIIYVDASSTEAIEKALEEFAVSKAIDRSYNDAINWLESCGERWLIVFDNADNPFTNIRKYIPTRGRGCSAIITTRLPDLARLTEGPNSLCHLSSMSRTDATALLVKIDFGCLALAIVHAGAYIAHSPSMTVTKYRDLFLSQRQRMLEEYSDLPVAAKLDDYGDTVYTTWRMSYEQLKPESRGLLWLVAYLHYDGISEDIFTRAAQNMHNPEKYSLPLTSLESQALDHVKLHLSAYLDSNKDWDTVAFIRAMADLTSYSLVDFDKMNLTYRVHVLVHDWARTVIPQASDLAIECTVTLLSLSVGSEEDAASLTFKRRLGLHVNSVLAHNPNIGPNHSDWLRRVYEETGLWSQKVQLDQQVLWAFQRELGDDNVKTWRIMSELAVSYAALGQWDAAERLQVRAMDAYKRLWGERHLQTLMAVGALAGTYFHMGRLEEAEKLQIQVLNSCKELRGKEHPETSIAMNNLANTYSGLGRCKQAERLQLQVLYIRMRELGEEHPRTLIAMNNLAGTYSKLGLWGKAEDLYLKAATVAERILGDQHPRVHLYRENLEKMLAQRDKDFAEPAEMVVASIVLYSQETRSHFATSHKRQNKPHVIPYTPRALSSRHPTHLALVLISPVMEAKLKALKVADLKEILTKSSTPIPTKANKADLIAKILATPDALKLAGGDPAPPPADPVPAPAKPVDDDLLAPPDEFDWDGTGAKPDGVASAEAKAVAESAPAPATSESAPAPAPTEDNAPKPAEEEVAKPAEGEASKPAEGEAKPAEGDAAKQADEELERRKARAARFGIPLVENPVSTKSEGGRGRRGKKGGEDKDKEKEKEKPASKPEEKKEAGKKPEEKKEKKEDKPKAMKISAKEAAPNDDDAKLAARAARFGISSAPKPAGESADPAEDDKRKKREARFATAPASKKAKTDA